MFVENLRLKLRIIISREDWHLIQLRYFYSGLTLTSLWFLGFIECFRVKG